MVVLYSYINCVCFILLFYIHCLGICNYKEATEGTMLYNTGCHARILSIADSYAYHVMSLMLVTILVHSLAVVMACCMARLKGQYSALT